jgi:hypothetical protein
MKSRHDVGTHVFCERKGVVQVARSRACLHAEDWMQACMRGHVAAAGAESWTRSRTRTPAQNQRMQVAVLRPLQWRRCGNASRIAQAGSLSAHHPSITRLWRIKRGLPVGIRNHRQRCQSKAARPSCVFVVGIRPGFSVFSETEQIISALHHELSQGHYADVSEYVAGAISALRVPDR